MHDSSGCAESSGVDEAEQALDEDAERKGLLSFTVGRLPGGQRNLGAVASLSLSQVPTIVATTPS